MSFVEQPLFHSQLPASQIPEIYVVRQYSRIRETLKLLIGDDKRADQILNELASLIDRVDCRACCYSAVDSPVEDFFCYSVRIRIASVVANGLLHEARKNVSIKADWQPVSEHTWPALHRLPIRTKVQLWTDTNAISRLIARAVMPRG